MKWIITLFTNNNLSIEYPENTYHIWDIIMSIFFTYKLFIIKNRLKLERNYQDYSKHFKTL